MGNAIIQIKILPSGVDVDLESMKKKVEDVINENNGMFNKIEEQEVAFGLKALVATFLWPETQEQEDIEKAIEGIENVSSTQIIDYRREFG